MSNFIQKMTPAIIQTLLSPVNKPPKNSPDFRKVDETIVSFDKNNLKRLFLPEIKKAI